MAERRELPKASIKMRLEKLLGLLQNDQDLVKRYLAELTKLDPEKASEIFVDEELVQKVLDTYSSLRHETGRRDRKVPWYQLRLHCLWHRSESFDWYFLKANRQKWKENDFSISRSIAGLEGFARVDNLKMEPIVCPECGYTSVRKEDFLVESKYTTSSEKREILPAQETAVTDPEAVWARTELMRPLLPDILTLDRDMDATVAAYRMHLLSCESEDQGGSPTALFDAANTHLRLAVIAEERDREDFVVKSLERSLSTFEQIYERALLPRMYPVIWKQIVAIRCYLGQIEAARDTLRTLRVETQSLKQKVEELKRKLDHAIKANTGESPRLRALVKDNEEALQRARKSLEQAELVYDRAESGTPPLLALRPTE